MKGNENYSIEAIKSIVRNAGEMILKAVRNPEMIDEKEGRANFVTYYDKMIQEYLKKELLEVFPDAIFVGEEEECHDSIQKGIAIIVDPIDGTTNFIKDYHMSCISVGILQDAKPYLGVVYNPYLDEMYSAMAGKGAFCNEKPIRVSKESLENGIVLFGTSPYYEQLSERSFQLAYQFFQKALDVRRSGSAALDLCAIASGRAELYFELMLSPWDYAAGALIVEEAGGTVTQYTGEELRYDKPCSIMAKGAGIR